MLIKKDQTVIQAYFMDKSNLPGGQADTVYFPASSKDITQVLESANQTNTPVTISGAGTGTTGGRIPFGGYVISMEKMDRILKIQRSPEITTVTVEAGVTLKALDDYLKDNDQIYAPNPTEYTAQIGATIANNSSGTHTFKFGATRKWVQGLTLVLPNGQLLKLSRGQLQAEGLLIGGHSNLPFSSVPIPSYTIPQTKNTAGYYAVPDMDLLDLFIGAEGTLGVIVEATLAIIPRPKSRLAFYLFFNDEADALVFASDLRGKRKSSSMLDPVCLEYFDSRALTFLRSVFGNIPANANGCIFAEQWLDSSEDSVLQAWINYLDRWDSVLSDTWCAQSEREHQQFEEIRHGLPVAINETIARYNQPKVSMDFAVPEHNFSELVDLYQRVLSKAGIQWLTFGHIGDCHLHLNLLPRDDSEYHQAIKIYKQLAETVVRLHGTLSAEHGIGKLKHHYLKLMYGTEGIHQMQTVKKAFDPKGILNRGNIFS
ncbi:FAD-binding oxidoreductase [Candidatus Margulisiibacteriota bacterium]